MFLRIVNSVDLTASKKPWIVWIREILTYLPLTVLFVERILILSEGQGEITSDDLPTDTASQAAGANGPVLQGLASLPLRDAREAFEREYLMVQIERFGGNISKTAQFVGMERSALHRKLKSLSIVSGVKQLD